MIHSIWNFLWLFESFRLWRVVPDVSPFRTKTEALLFRRRYSAMQLGLLECHNWWVPQINRHNCFYQYSKVFEVNLLQLLSTQLQECEAESRVVYPRNLKVHRWLEETIMRPQKDRPAYFSQRVDSVILNTGNSRGGFPQIKTQQRISLRASCESPGGVPWLVLRWHLVASTTWSTRRSQLWSVCWSASWCQGYHQTVNL